MRAAIAVLIPALNEQDSLPGVLQGLNAQGLDLEIVICDNGSEDNTRRIAVEMGATLVIEPRRGYGAACRAGLKLLEERDTPPKVVVICDADGADDPGDLRALVDPLLKGDVDFTIGSRILGHAAPGALTPQAEFGNWLATNLMALGHGRRFTDLGPFRALKFDALVSLDMEDPTWGWNVEMQLKALKKGLTIEEIPVKYHPRQAGESKISGSLIGATRAGFRILYSVVRYG